MGPATFYYKNSNAPKPNKPNHIGATILINYDGKVLLESRKDSERWAFIGGGLFLNETLLECVKRETFEETGIILSDEDIEFCKLYDDPSIIIAYPDGNIIRSMMALYEVTLKKMPDLRCSEESVELRFFSKEELKNIKIVETHTPILEDYFAECTNPNLSSSLSTHFYT